MKTQHIAFLVAAGVAMTACGGTSNKFSRAGMAEDAKTQLVGKPKDEILACMGAPARTASLSGTEVWTYLSGGDSSSFATAQGQSLGTTTTVTGFGSTLHRSCEVDVVFSGDEVSRINYRGRTGGIVTQGEQCAFAVAACMGE